MTAIGVEETSKTVGKKITQNRDWQMRHQRTKMDGQGNPQRQMKKRKRLWTQGASNIWNNVTIKRKKNTLWPAKTAEEETTMTPTAKR